jgi:hypothetical protein
MVVKLTSSPAHLRPSIRARTLVALACVCASLSTAQILSASASADTAGTTTGQTGLPEVPTPTPKPSASATLQQCLTAAAETERSATFAGEMTAIAGTTRMEMQVNVLERTSEEMTYHTVTAPGLGVWRSSDTGVKAYTYLKQVTNLSAPAFYRGAVRFRWLNAKGHIIKTLELRTQRCEQPAPSVAEIPAAGTESTPTSG